MSGALHVGMAAVGAVLGSLGYVRTLQRGHLDPDRVRLPWAVAMALGLVLSRFAFALERGLDWSEMLRPVPGGTKYSTGTPAYSSAYRSNSPATTEIRYETCGTSIR